MGSESIDSSDFDSSESHSEAMRARVKNIPLLAS